MTKDSNTQKKAEWSDLLRSFSFVLMAVLFIGCNQVVREEVDKPEQISQNAWDLAELTNEHREAMGLPALEWDTDLWRVARRHNEDMSDRAFFSHFNPDGEGPFDRLRGIYIMYYYAGENLAVGQTAPEVVLSNWLRSYEHRVNIESYFFTHQAVAFDSTNNYWTHLFINFGDQKPFPLIRGWTLYPRIPPKN